MPEVIGLPPHGHTAEEITGLEGAEVLLEDVTGLPEALADKADSDHSHEGGGLTLSYVSGYWYDLTGTVATAQNTMGQNFLWAIPFKVYGEFTIDRLIQRSTATATGAVARLGLYEDGGGLPGDLVTEFGTFDYAASGDKNNDVPNTDLVMGRWWLGMVAQGNFLTMQMGPTNGYVGRDQNPIHDGLATSAYNTPYGCAIMTTASTFSGALPASFPTAHTGRTQAPFTLFKAA